MRTMRPLTIIMVLWLSRAAMGQFGVPSPTDVRERITGNFLETTGAPVPEAGDQIAAFFGAQVIGRFVFEVDSGREFEILLYGDDPDTSTAEGPEVNQRVSFKFYDSSSNQTIDLEVLNASGEVFLMTFQGEEVPPLPVPLPGLDLTPTRNLDLRVAGSNSGGGGGSGSTVSYDVDGNGRIETEDAALVLRLITGSPSSVPTEVRKRADVNGDGKVNSADAIAILRNR